MALFANAVSVKGVGALEPLARVLASVPPRWARNTLASRFSCLVKTSNPKQSVPGTAAKREKHKHDSMPCASCAQRGETSVDADDACGASALTIENSQAPEWLSRTGRHRGPRP